MFGIQAPTVFANLYLTCGYFISGFKVFSVLMGNLMPNVPFRFMPLSTFSLAQQPRPVLSKCQDVTKKSKNNFLMNEIEELVSKAFHTKK